MICAFKIKFWETFNTPGYYDILMESKYKEPNSNDGCMRLRAPTTCPEWNKGTDEDTKVLHWLSLHVGLPSECVSKVVEPFARRRMENTTSGETWNEAARRSATRKVMRPPPSPTKVVEPNTASSSSTFEQYTLLDRLTDANAQPTPTDDTMVIDESVKTVADWSNHPDAPDDVVEGDLVY
jgi:hypothetical protein